jgi:hypothetical protein
LAARPVAAAVFVLGLRVEEPRSPPLFLGLSFSLSLSEPRFLVAKTPSLA